MTLAFFATISIDNTAAGFVRYFETLNGLLNDPLVIKFLASTSGHPGKSIFLAKEVNELTPAALAEQQAKMDKQRSKQQLKNAEKVKKVLSHIRSIVHHI